MRFKFANLIFSVLLAVFAVSVSPAQDASTRSGRSDPSKEDLPTGIKETLAKARIRSEEKDFNELIGRGAEAAKLGAELSESFARNQVFASADLKKIEAMEKLVKKIRRDLGGKDNADESPDEVKITNMENAFLELRENSLRLSEELKKTSRYSISVKAVESSNTLLTIVQFIKLNGKSL